LKKEQRMEKTKKIHCFIVGAKGVSFYGGYESFVQKLLEYHKDNVNIQYHVACKANGEGSMDVTRLEGASKVKNHRFTYYHADCFLIDVPEWLKSAQAILYDIAALKECCTYIERYQIQNFIVYILACRIGPFVHNYIKRIHQLGGKVYLNPDGHEWKRAKWSAPVRRYWKESERLMVKYADLVICDSMNIKKYIQHEYKNYKPKTTFIAYGAEMKQSVLADNDPKYVDWLKQHKIKDSFFVAIGRCVPENNYETMIREFMKSRTKRDFVIISTANDRFLEKLENKLHFRSDSRIKFVGTVYDQELLKKIREQAYGYLHGHEVGGTNPSLLEALGATKLNLLLDVGFNKEVAKEGAIYWTKEKGNLARLIEKTDHMESEEIKVLESKAKSRIQEEYSWERIADLYEKVFLRLER